MKVSIIVAIDEKGGIGKDNQLLWHIPEDLKRFKQITSGHPIIMGRKTYESIGRVLPNRKNIIITRDPSYSVENAVIVDSLEKALDEAKKEEKEEIFVIGGGQIFSLAVNLADRLYLTVVKGDFGADTFFPDYSQFTNVIEQEEGQSGEYEYTFFTLDR